jgi:hypothetical protein
VARHPQLPVACMQEFSHFFLFLPSRPHAITLQSQAPRE